MSPTKQIRPARPGMAKKKASVPVEAKRVRGPAPMGIVGPIVGGIALIATIASILYLRGKK